MAKKKPKTAKRNVSSVKLKGRRTSARTRNKEATRAAGRYVLPIVISGVLLVCIVFLGAAGYKTATASDFFRLQAIEVRGNERTATEDIRRIVASAVEKPGVWNADLSDIRTKVEKFPFVKAASVSMTLPAGIRVTVTERVPAAVVHVKAGNFLVDGEGAILAAAGSEKEFPFVLQGWDETKTERVVTENIARLKLYKKMIDEWQQFDLVSRVKQVNIADTREPVAVVEDSGRDIAITLAKDNFGKSLKTAIEAVSGKGSKVRSVDAGGIYPVIQYLEF
jgi:cell division septal protein FtsQ